MQRERDELRDEVEQLRKKMPDQSHVRAIADAQVNATLEKINMWLEVSNAVMSNPIHSFMAWSSVGKSGRARLS